MQAVNNHTNMRDAFFNVYHALQCSLFGGNVAVYNVFAFGTWFVLLTLGFTMD
jgi:hypothetical protein